MSRGRPAIVPHKDDNGDWWFGTSFAAGLLSITTQSLKNMEGGAFAPPKHSNPPANGVMFNAKAFGQWMINIYSQKTHRKAPSVQMPGFEELNDQLSAGNTSSQLNRATLRLKVAQAEKAEVESLEAQGSVVMASDVEKSWADTLSLIKTRMLKVPYASASLIDGDMSASDIQAIIDEEIRRALNDAVDGIDPDADIVDEDE